MKKRIVAVIPQDEELTIRLLIGSSKDFQVRLGLIKLCECYQKGQRLNSPQDIREKLKSFIWEKRLPDRARWALKIIAEMRNPDDHDVILPRLRTPPDDPPYYAENMAWTIIAFHAVANSRQIEEAYDKNIIARDAVALIAYELAEVEGTIPNSFPRINIQNADEVLLKCACVCMATSRNLRGVFEPKFKQEEQLIALNSHHAGEVSQYSIYAMFRLPKLTFEQLGFRIDELPKKPVEVRRWAYRLLSKRRQSIVGNRDLFEEIIRTEENEQALEGLALGLKDIWYDGIEVPIVDWYQSQLDDRVKMALLEHMARQSEKSSTYADFVIDQYKGETSSQLTRARLKEAAATTRLYNILSEIDEEQNAKQGSLILNIGSVTEFNMNKNTQTFKGGNVTIGVNTLGGNSTSNKVSQEIQLNQDMRNLISKLQEIASSDQALPTGKNASEALKQLEKSPSRASLMTALESVRKWSAVGALAAEVAAFAKDFIDAAANLLS